MEFVLFGRLSKVVHRIAQNDTTYIRRLYKYVDVPFEPSFDKAIHVGRTMSKHQNSIIATQYNLIDPSRQRKYAHHISLWFNQNGSGFLFDPLGEVTGKEKLKMEVYQDYPIIRDVFGMNTTRGEGIHWKVPHHSTLSIFNHLFMLEHNWRYFHMKDVDMEKVASQIDWFVHHDIEKYSRVLLEKVFNDV